MRATELDWSKIQRFKPQEWPVGTLPMMNANVIEALNKWRNMLPPSHAMNPSPLFEAHVRLSGKSRHSVEGARLSDATDVFIKPEHLWDAWLAAQQVPEIGGIGLYLDTKPTTMMHIDCRPVRLLWVRVKGVYTYYHNDPIGFFKALAKSRDNDGGA